MKLTLDINSYCNLRCEFCYQELDGSKLGEEEIFRAIDEDGVSLVEIGGGEPFLDKRVVDIIDSIRRRGKEVHVSTNGTVIPPAFLDLESRAGEIGVQVSLHASNPRLYEQVTGRDFFGKVIKNVQLLRQHFPVNLSSTVYQTNFEDVPNLVELAEDLSLPLRVNLVFPVGKGKNVSLLDRRQVDQLKGYLLGERVRRREAIDSPLIHENNCYALAEAYGVERKGICPLDCGKVYVSPNGKVGRCEFYSEASSGGGKNE